VSIPNSPPRLALGFVWQFGLVAAFFPMLPIYLDSLGVSASDIAFLISVQALSALFTVQLYGYLADQVMKRTTLLKFMSVVASLVAALFPLLPAQRWWLALGMVGIALFFMQRIMLYNALVLDSRRGEELYGRMRFLGSLSFAILSVSVGWLADQPVFTPAIMWPILVFFELMFVLSLMLLRDATPEERTGLKAGRLSFRQAQKLLFSNPLMIKFLIFVFLFHWVGGPPHVMQTKLLRVIGSTSMVATSCLAFAALCEMAIFFFGNEVLRTIRLMPLLAMIPAAVAVRYWMIWISPTPPVIFLSNTLHLFTFGLAYLCGVIFIHREAPRELKSSAQTLFGLTFGMVAIFFGNIGSSLLLNLLTTRFDMTDAEALPLMYGIMGSLALLAFFAWFPMKREYERKHGVSGFWVK